MTRRLKTHGVTAGVCALLAAVVLLAGCGYKRPVLDAAVPEASPDQSGLQESLFKGDQEVLSNSDIDRILAARVTMDDRHRMAVLGFGSRPAWSQTLADLDEQNSQALLRSLSGAGQLS